MAVLKRIPVSAAAAIALFALLGVAGEPIGPSAHAAQPGGLVNTQEVYAAFTLNLTRFISWPDGTFAAPDAPFVIGTFPRDPINEELDAIVAGERIDKHPVKTMRIDSLDDLAQCHAVFLSRRTATPAVLARLANKPILTVSDADGFLDLGGHVRFVPQAGGTRLRISAENLKASGLESRAQLLRLASSP